jgi:hypothetical protein
LLGHQGAGGPECAGEGAEGEAGPLAGAVDEGGLSFVCWVC